MLRRDKAAANIPTFARRSPSKASKATYWGTPQESLLIPIISADNQASTLSMSSSQKSAAVMIRNLLLLVAATFSLAACQPASLGIFDDATDIGSDLLEGRTEYHRSSDTYRVTGGGADLWADRDDFHFAWKQVVGDLTMKANVAWANEDGHERKKAGWMVRSGLETDDPYLDVAVHNNGLVSLQMRKEKGGQTTEIQTAVSAQADLILERTGDVFSLFAANDTGTLTPAASIEIPL